jgi:chemotaxis response regulator CheB
MCKVLIADDSELMRTAIRKMLQEVSNIDVVGEAANFADTMQKIADLKPDVLLLDLHMPEKRDFTPAVVKSQLGTVQMTPTRKHLPKATALLRCWIK